MKTLSLTHNEMRSFFEDDSTIDPCDGLEYVYSNHEYFSDGDSGKYELIVRKEGVHFKFEVEFYGNNNNGLKLYGGPYVGRRCHLVEKLVKSWEFSQH